MRFFPLFFGLILQNSQIFGIKFNLDNSYTWVILKLFGKVLILSNPPYPLKGLKMRFFPLFFRSVHRNCLIFGTKVNLDNTKTLLILKWFVIILIPSNTLNPLKARGWGSRGKKTSQVYFKVLSCMISTLFSACQKNFPFSRYFSPNLEPAGPDSTISYTFSFKN